jgi:hypothetical protein
VYLTQHRDTMRVVHESCRKTGAWPVRQHVERELARRGIEPDECLATVPPEFLILDDAQSPGGRVRLTVKGLHHLEPQAPELRLFIVVLRGCVDAYLFHIPDSPSQAQPLHIEGSELVRSDAISRATLHAVGLLLEAEDVAPIEFQVGGSSPWRAELGVGILRFKKVAILEDFLALPNRAQR